MAAKTENGLKQSAGRRALAFNREVKVSSSGSFSRSHCNTCWVQAPEALVQSQPSESQVTNATQLICYSF